MLSSIRSDIRRQQQFVLGLHGLFGPIGDTDETESRREVWNQFLRQLSSNIETEWQISPRLHSVHSSENQARGAIRRYDHMRIVSQWKQDRLSLIDLQYDQIELISQFGRYCDGVILVLASNSSSATKLLTQVQSQNIHWLGYWKLQLQASPRLQKVG